MIAVLQSRGVEGLIKANSDQQRLRAWRSGCPVSAAPVNLVDQLWRKADVNMKYDLYEVNHRENAVERMML
jgi:hypothetical protein